MVRPQAALGGHQVGIQKSEPVKARGGPSYAPSQMSPQNTQGPEIFLVIWGHGGGNISRLGAQ